MDKKLKAKKRGVEGFFDCWKDKDFHKIAVYCQKTWLSQTQGQFENVLIKILGEYDVKSYKIGGIERDGAVAENISVEVVFSIKGRRNSTITVYPKTVFEEAPYRPSDTGDCGVNPLSILKDLNIRGLTATKDEK